LLLKLIRSFWIDAHDNLIVIDAAGVGKNRRDNYSVPSQRVPKLFTDLALAGGADATNESSVPLSVFNYSSILVCLQSTPTRATICWRSLNNGRVDDQQSSPVSSPQINGMASLKTPPTPASFCIALFITLIASLSPARACARNAGR
jgi:hypothetical protein